MHLITWLKKNGFQIDKQIIQRFHIDCSSILDNSYLGNISYWVYEEKTDFCEPILILNLKDYTRKIWTIVRVYSDENIIHGEHLTENEIKVKLKKYIL